MLNLAAAALVFWALHHFSSTRWRATAVTALGEGPYLGVYSAISIAAFIWLVYAFSAAPGGAPLFSAGVWWSWLKAALMLLAFVLIMGGYLTPNPTTPKAGKLLDRPGVAGGIFAITRHPIMWGIAIWAIAHLISRPDLRGLLFFGALAMVALFGSRSQEQRKAAEYGESWRRFAAQTSFFPFAALASGRARLDWARIGWRRLAIAAALWLAFLLLHRWLFGGAALPGL